MGPKYYYVPRLQGYSVPGESTTAETTTIEVRTETWQELNQLKEGPGDTFDAVVTRLLEAYKEQP